ncbi:NAD(P)-binding protein [Acinetobacter baumannii]|uniref:NAD(P)-binding protein n=1 Tax=Acinetobacter baumannii TaxID=470 RepID=UPI0011208A9F|nr:FAD/NAD(P)-binding protein [Acinetobacter baumannii]
MDIAIIGSGMAGLAAARILKDAGHTITIFEALPGRGMDSHSIEFDGGIIDAPLRVMNPHLWKNTLSLAAHLGIKTFPVRTYMSCSWLFEDRTETWLTTSRSRIGNFPIINNRKGIQQYGWRPVVDIDPKKVISKVTLTRAVVDSQTIALNKELQQRHLEPNRKVFYCGSWSCDGLPILESAVTSAMHIAEILGAPLPFVGLKPKVEVAPELGY